MYLIDVINERHLKKAFELLSSHVQAISPNVQREQCSNFISSIRYQLFGKMNAFAQHLTEPLIINVIPDKVKGYEFLRDEWQYYKFDIKRDDWDYVLYLGCFRMNGYLCISLFQRNLDHSVYGQTLYFNDDSMLVRFQTFTITLTDENKIFPKEGTNYLLLDEKFGFCYKKKYIDALSFETLLSCGNVKDKLIINKPPKEETENGTNST